MTQTRGSAIVVIASLILMGAIIADVLIHPQGTQAAGNAAAGIWKPSLNAVLGFPS